MPPQVVPIFWFDKSEPKEEHDAFSAIRREHN